MDQFSYFRKGSNLRKASEVSRRYFGWSLPLYIVVEKKDGKIFTVEDQKKLEKLNDEIKRIDGVNGTMSVIDFTRLLGISLPLIQVINRNTKEFSDFMSDGTIRILVKTPYTDTLNTEKLMEKMKEIFKYFKGYTFGIVGPTVVTASLNSRMVEGQFITVILSFLFIFGLLIVVFKKILLSLIASIPVVLTTFLNFIFMFFFKISLEISTSIVSSMLMGLVIDYSIHFVSKYMRMKSVKLVIQNVGSVMLSNSISLSLGFASLVFAPLLLYAKLGLLLSLGIFSGVMITLITIPPFLENTA